jgi:hypothetical protein
MLQFLMTVIVTFGDGTSPDIATRAIKVDLGPTMLLGINLLHDIQSLDGRIQGGNRDGGVFWSVSKVILD